MIPRRTLWREICGRPESPAAAAVRSKSTSEYEPQPETREVLKRKNRSNPMAVLEPRLTDWASRALAGAVGVQRTPARCTTVSGASDWPVMSRSDWSL